MIKRRFSALFLTLTLLFCTLPATAAEGDGWLVPKVQEASVFTDMAGVWCEEAVQMVCEAGLMQGRSDGSFSPSSDLMPEHVVTICARLYDLLTGGDGVLPEPADGQNWYDPSYEYLAEAIDYRGTYAPGSGEYLGGGDGAQTPEEQLNALRFNFNPGKYPVSRQSFLNLLNQTLQTADVSLPAINQISMVPDCKDPAVLAFYNAGVLTGSDQYGTFHGNEYLNRGQAAAILARLVAPSQRQAFTPEPFDLCADVLGVEHSDVLLTVDGIDITAEQIGPILVRCLFYLSPEEGLNDAITQAKETVAARRLMEELGYTIDQGQLAEAEEFAQERSGLYGITANGFLWESMRGLYESALHPYILRKYGDKNYLSGMEEELREKAQTLTVVPSETLTSLDLDAIKAKSENAPIYWR